MKYKSLNAAAKHVKQPGLARGKTKIWYWKPEYSRDYLMGYQWLKDEGIPVPTAKTITQTHIKLGAIRETDPGNVYHLLQGEVWSPQGEATDMLQELGLSHTSMSIGDVIQRPDGTLLMVDTVGFQQLTPTKNPDDSRRDLPQLVQAAEAELRRANDAIHRDHLEALRSAVLASYYSGAAIYLARQQRSAPMLDRAHSVFFRANLLAQSACGAKWDEAVARYAPNPSTYDDMQKALRDTQRTLARAKRTLEAKPSVTARRRALKQLIESSSHAGALWAFAKCELHRERKTAHWQKLMRDAQSHADDLRDRAAMLADEALRSANPFVKPHVPMEPILIYGYPEIHRYRGWTIEASPWPKDRLVEWMGKAQAPDGSEFAVFSDVGKHEALRAVKIMIDFEEADLGIDAEIFWAWLLEFVKETRSRPLTRENLARLVELTRRQLPSFAAGTQKELGPAFDWFHAQSPSYRIRLLDRALEVDRLLRGPKAPAGIPRHGRPPTPNRGASSMHLKRRLLRR